MKKITLIGFLLLTLNTFGQVTLDSTQLPIIIVQTDNNSEPIDEPKRDADMMIIDNGPGNYNKPGDAPNDYDGRIGIELRGSSSQFFDKKSFGVELRTAANADTSASILGLPVEEDWVFHGPYSDKSLIRNVLAFELASKLGWYSSKYRLFELILNGDYRGVYILLEKVKRDNDRIDIARLDEDDIAGDSLTGGYIIKVDKFDGSNSGDGFASQYPPIGRTRDDQIIYFQFDYPKGRNIQPEQADYIQQYINNFENTLLGRDWKDPQVGYRAYINEDSFVDLALLNEITRNVDAYRLSTFLYKDRDDNGGKMHIGPPWDYNLAFGNANYCAGSSLSGWAWDFNDICNEDFWLNPFWWDRLLKDGAFVDKLIARWEELRSGAWRTEAIHTFIDSVANVLEKPAQRNFERWPVLGEYLWPNQFVGNTHAEEINYLKDWTAQRASWMDTAIPSLDLITGIGEGITGAEVRLFPNPVRDRLTVESPDAYIHRIYLTDLTGRVLFEVEAGARKSWEGLLTDIPAGVYVVNVQLEGGEMVSRKVVKGN